MIGLLPFAVLIVLGAIALLAWSGSGAMAAYRQRKPVPMVTLVSLITALGMTAFLARVAVALTIGLAHSRAPFEYTRVHAWACFALIFALPGSAVVAYHVRAKKASRPGCRVTPSSRPR